VYHALVKRPWPRWIRLVVWAALGLAAVVFVVWVALPWPGDLATRNPGATSFMRYREAEAREQGKRLEIRQEWVPLARVPRDLVSAVLVSEDDRFREHHGVDWKALATEVHWTGGDTFSWARPADWVALARAVGYAWHHRHEIKGRSTITQQLAKNLYFTPKRSFLRKAEELVVARRLERSLTKDRILELYLNTVELGPGLFGVGAAARHYFGVPVWDLDTFQAASLAATLPQPLTSNPAHRPGRMAWRRDLILERLAGRDVVIPAEPPGLSVPPSLPDSTLPGDSARTDTLSGDTLPAPKPARDTLAPDTIPRGTLPAHKPPRDTLAPDTIPIRVDTTPTPRSWRRPPQALRR
jgi:monofunctional biosynthetic peptidoglycan transglycosylase